MDSRISDDNFFTTISAESDGATSVGMSAPARLKSKIYSALVRRQAQSGPLLSLSETEAAGRRLCVFENLVEVSPVGEKYKCLNLCTVCHARILAEQIEGAPIFWAHCPYVAFQQR